MRILGIGLPILRRCLMSFGALLLIAIPAFGQLTGTIQGQVTDISGAVVPGASITATNKATGIVRTAVSAEDGFYRITDLLPGVYEARVALSGFKTAVRTNLEVAGKSVVGINFSLEVGQVTESVEVSSEGAQVETQVARVSEVLEGKELQSIPIQGRGYLNVVMVTPGIVGKQEQSGVYCCDVFSNYGTPRINSGANEQKGSFGLDGIDLRYSEGSGWGASFTPSPDAIQEVRVTTDPQSSAEFGRMSGPQIQVITKGGTNQLHGTAHFLYQDDAMNARPFFSSSIPDTTYKLFGGTVGGAIKKDRLFFFGAYEGLRSRQAGTGRTLVETQAFRDFVVKTRPNTIAAKLLQSFTPLRYPTSDLIDVGSPLPGVFNFSTVPDGIPDLGEITLDAPFDRDGTQFNGRIDFHAPNNKDRIFGTYWYSRPEWGRPGTRPVFDYVTSTKVQSAHFTHTHSFTANTLNEFRFGADYIDFNDGVPRYPNIPNTGSDDGFGIGAPSWSIYYSDVYYAEDVFSINRGKHSFKFGATYRNSNLLAGWPNPPSFTFASILDFADDEPYAEDRVIDTKGGQSNPSRLVMTTGDFAVYSQNTWQIRSNLTLNYGLRWETYFPVALQDKDNWQPHLSSAQLNAQAVAQVANTQAGGRLYSRNFGNFGPRLGLAWDPTHAGKMSVRFGFGVLYDEINSFNLYGVDSNPPALAYLSAGTQLGIPVVYGLAPDGTNNFPINPALKQPKLSAKGGIEGQRVNLTGFMTDLRPPRIYDVLGGVQYQLQKDLLVQVNYKYRKGTNELAIDDLNRYQGDLVDGRLDRLNPEFNRIAILTNRGERVSHNLIANVTKRFSAGWSVSGSYNYANASNNFGYVTSAKSEFYQAGSTDAYNLNLEWARDDIPHTFTAHSVWQLPIFRNRSDWVGRIIGGWELNTIWNFQAGSIFSPTSTAAFGSGGDFNADGQRSGFIEGGRSRGDRPDKPTQSLPQSFSKSDWLKGALSPSVFPLPDPSTPRPGTLPKDAFRAPGYANIDAALVKGFRLPIWGAEDGRVEIRGEFFNVLNRLNISSVESRINASNFARATGALPNRVVQLAVKFLF